MINIILHSKVVENAVLSLLNVIYFLSCFTQNKTIHYLGIQETFYNCIIKTAYWILKMSTPEMSKSARPFLYLF